MAMTMCRWPGATPDSSRLPDPLTDVPASEAPQRAVLGGGCFWCVEAVFRRLDGVLAVTSGYAGGDPAQANYAAVCTGRSGHAEVVAIDFDARRISFGALLKVFFAVAHDPTQVDRQGHDVGPQYRSVVFAVDTAQYDVAVAYIRQLDAGGHFPAPIATRVERLDQFHPAEPEHQDYADRHPRQPYIAAVAAPKLRKLAEWFAGQLDGARR